MASGRQRVHAQIGLIHTPIVDWEEALWNYRMQGTVAMERAGFLTSADLGAGIDLNVRAETVNGSLVVVNGEGYQNPEVTGSKDVEARVSFRLLKTDDASRVGGLRLTGYGHLGKNADGGTRDRWLGIASYKSNLFTLAAEYAIARNGLLSAPPTPVLNDIDANVFSAFGVLNFLRSNLALIARVDAVDPNHDLSNDGHTRFIGGVSYRLAPNVRLLADIDFTDFDGGVAPAVAATRKRGLFQTEFVF